MSIRTWLILVALLGGVLAVWQGLDVELRFGWLGLYVGIGDSWFGPFP